MSAGGTWRGLDEFEDRASQDSGVVALNGKEEEELLSRIVKSEPPAVMPQDWVRGGRVAGRGWDQWAAGTSRDGLQ